MQEYVAGHPGDVTIRQVADGIKWDSGGRSAYRITTVLKQFGYTLVQRRVAGARKAVLDPARQESDRRPRPRRGHMTHKRETDPDRERRVVRAVIKG